MGGKTDVSDPEIKCVISLRETERERWREYSVDKEFKVHSTGVKKTVYMLSSETR